jgi:hypothetical protein
MRKGSREKFQKITLWEHLDPTVMGVRTPGDGDVAGETPATGDRDGRATPKQGTGTVKEWRESYGLAIITGRTECPGPEADRTNS